MPGRLQLQARRGYAVCLPGAGRPLGGPHDFCSRVAGCSARGRPYVTTPGVHRWSSQPKRRCRPTSMRNCAAWRPPRRSKPRTIRIRAASDCRTCSVAAPIRADSSPATAARVRGEMSRRWPDHRIAARAEIGPPQSLHALLQPRLQLLTRELPFDPAALARPGRYAPISTGKSHRVPLGRLVRSRPRRHGGRHAGQSRAGTPRPDCR